MGDRSKIEWTEATWTPIHAFLEDALSQSGTRKTGWHCEHVSEGCRNCYAESINRRLGTGLDFKPGHRSIVEIFLDEKMLLQPLRWARPRRIFVCSMTDLFASFVPDEMIDRIFAIMALCPQHTFQVLTKRPERMQAYLSDGSRHERVSLAAVDAWLADGREDLRRQPKPLNVSFRRIDNVDRPDGAWPLPNVWLGTSCEDQATADARVPDLLATPAAIRFVSAEPLLGPIDFTAIDISGDEEVLPLGAAWLDRLDELEGVEQAHLDWIVVGGESGRGARPMHPDWARAIRDQCAAAGVAYFHKQNGEWIGVDEIPSETLEDLELRGLPIVSGAVRVGKKAAGRLLDGVAHDGIPEVPHG